MGLSGRAGKGGNHMEIKAMTEQQRQALVEVSIVVYGEELTRIMIPELKDYLNGVDRGDESPEIVRGD